MTQHKENAAAVHRKVMPVLNGLHYQDGIPVRDINAAVLGMVTSSLGADIGPEQARDFIESAMRNVWGKPKKSLWQRLRNA